MKKFKRGIIIVNICIVLLALFVYFNDYYKSDTRVDKYLKSDDKVIVKKIDTGYYFDGPGTDSALIFYPGGKVEYTAYAPLMHKLASNGIDTYIVEMPLNLAFLNTNKANKIINKYKYKNWYVGGHSLGGVSISRYTIKHTNEIKGIILLGSYPTRKIDGIRLLSIIGSNDKVLDKNEYEKNKSNWPINSKEYIIDGGNHSYFGSYGKQSGDGDATITNIEQEDITVREIVKFIEEG